jgi:hypothetical protein
MWVFLEIGPFTPVVLVCYLAFLDPVWVASLVRATARRRHNPRSTCRTQMLQQPSKRDGLGSR